MPEVARADRSPRRVSWKKGSETRRMKLKAKLTLSRARLIALEVDDLDKAVQFYKELLDADPEVSALTGKTQIVLRRSVSGRPLLLLSFDVTAVVTGPHRRTLLEVYGNTIAGMHHKLERLLLLGATLYGDVPLVDRGGVVQIHDPFGHLLLLTVSDAVEQAPG